MNKKFNLSIVILCLIEIVCCFTPFCLNQECWERTTYRAAYKMTQCDGVSIFRGDRFGSYYAAHTALGIWLAVLLVCLAVAVAVVHFIKMNNHATKITNKSWIFAVAHTVAMIAFLVYIGLVELKSGSYRYYRYVYSINWMSYIIIALNLIILILAIVLTTEKVNKSFPEKIVAIAAINEKTESVDDLLIYKELLDSGVISQNEFETKKRQILGK